MSPKAPGTNKEPSLINVALICCNNYPDSLTAYQGSGLAYYTYTSSCHRCDSNCTRNSCPSFHAARCLCAKHVA